jgi:hypothetical protein
MRVALLTPTVSKPHDAFIASLEAAVPALDAAGIEHSFTLEAGSAYISWARANMLHKALQGDAEYFIFLDHDVGFGPGDLLKLVETKDDVVCGTYRFKADDEEYMGAWHCDEKQRPLFRQPDLAIKAHMFPAGFLKVSRNAVRVIMLEHPELLYGMPEKPAVDLFNHGAHIGGRLDFRWWGEDYAFAHRWDKLEREAWLLPDLNVDHWQGEVCYKGNLHQYLLRRPGGLLAAKAA